MNKKSENNLPQLIEALIFAAPEPVKLENLVEIIGNISADEIVEHIESLNLDYENQNRAFQIIKGAGGYRYATLPEFGPYVKKLVIGSGRIRLSRAALETVSLIAYRQPINRADVEAIRGVDVSGILRMLLERKLIQANANSSKPGKQRFYETTPDFLRYFGIDSLEDLPKPENFLVEEELSEFEQQDLGFNNTNDANNA